MSSPFDFDLPPSSDGRYDAYDTTTVILVGLLCPVTTIAIALRFLARWKTKAKFWWDDWMALASLPFFYAFSAIALAGVENGGGYPDMLLVPLANLAVTTKAAFAGPIISAACITATKLAALLLYTRIFRQDKTFRIAFFVIGVMGVAWLIGALFAYALRCSPAYYALDPIQTLGPNCWSLQRLFIATEIPNCILDFLIVFLPLVIIGKLKLRQRDKIMLSFVFLLGGLVSIVSIVRMIEVYTIDGLAFINKSSYWLLGQQAAAILCICLPLYKPLFSATSVPSPVRKAYAYLTAQALRRTKSSGASSSAPSPGNRKEFLHQSTSSTYTTITSGNSLPSSRRGTRSSLLTPVATIYGSLASPLKRALINSWRPPPTGQKAAEETLKQNQRALHRPEVASTMKETMSEDTGKIYVNGPTIVRPAVDKDKALPATPVEVALRQHRGID